MTKEQKNYYLKHALYEAIESRVNKDRFISGQVNGWYEVLKEIDTDFAYGIKIKANDIADLNSWASSRLE